jgi:putative ABC transport system permease protein
MRHKLMTALLIAVIALSCAIVSNGVFLLTQRMQRMHMPAGFAESEVVELVLDDFYDAPDAKARASEDLARLRRIPGVKAATLTDAVPFDAAATWGGYIALDAEDAAAGRGPLAAFYTGEDFAQALGLRLVAGRWLDPNSFIDFAAAQADERLSPHEALVTRALAERMWPGQDPLGKQFYYWGARPPATVVGVVEHLPRPVIEGPADADYSVVLPMRMALGQGGSYLLRTEPGRREEVIRQAVQALRSLDPHRVVLEQRTMEAVRAEQFAGDAAMAGLLLGLCAALLLVTGLGIVGLSAYWVRQRRRQVGVRRALGATRGDILRYFLVENFLFTSMGIVLGMAMAYGLSMLLMHYYELPRLPPYYFPVGAVALWLTGQLAALAPALRAAAIPPATAASA